jgi:hypothetical protein
MAMARDLTVWAITLGLVTGFTTLAWMAAVWVEGNQRRMKR